MRVSSCILAALLLVALSTGADAALDLLLRRLRHSWQLPNFASPPPRLAWLQPLLAALRLSWKLLLAGQAPAVTLRGDVLPKRAHGFARDDLAADRGLDRHLEHMRRDQLLELFRHGAAAALGASAMHQHSQCVDRFAVDQHLQLDQLGGAIIGQVIIE